MEATRSLPLRLDRYLRDATGSPLEEVRSSALLSRVRIQAGDTSTWLCAPTRDELVFFGDTVVLDAEPLFRPKRLDYLALNKPARVTSSTRDADGQTDLSGWVRMMPKGVFPIGRLDRMTSGLLLFTNDGDLAHAILHPLHHVEKTYLLSLGGRIESVDARWAQLIDGVRVAGEPRSLRATRVNWLNATDKRTEVRVALREGKYHQIRKMCGSLGLRVRALHRVSIGGVEFGELSKGEFRMLSDEEVQRLWRAVGGRELVERLQLVALERRAALARRANAPLRRLEDWLSLHGRQSRCDCTTVGH